MILINYAYSAEVKTLKELVDKANFQKKVAWLRLASSKPRLGQWLNMNAFPMKPELILNMGFAGNLNSNFSLGDVVLIDKILAERKRILEESVIASNVFLLAKQFIKNR